MNTKEIYSMLNELADKPMAKISHNKGLPHAHMCAHTHKHTYKQMLFDELTLKDI